MKKFSIILATMAICATSANAQNTDAATSANPVAMQKQANPEAKKMRQERFENASPEQKQKMMERREKFKSLNPQQKQEVKTERERHHEEMKRITGTSEKEKH